MNFKINWHLKYANEPEITLELEGPKPNWSTIVHHVLPLEGITAAIAYDKGIAHFGIYRNYKGEKPLATSSGKYLITVEQEGERRQIEFNGWSSSRASVMNALFPDLPTVTDVWTTLKGHGYIGYATMDLVEQNVQHIPAGVWFLVAKLVDPEPIEDNHFYLIPSLAPDKFSLPSEKCWQEETLNEKYRIVRAYGSQL